MKNIYYLVNRNFKFLKEKINWNRPNDEDKQVVLGDYKRKIPKIKQFKQIKYFLSSKEKKIILICILFVILSSLSLLLKFSLNLLVDVPRNGGEYTEGLVGSISYINPILSQTNDVDRDISKLVFSGLFRINKNGELEKDLVESYEISEDKKVYTFQLRKDIYFHDDVKLTSEDVEFTFSAIQNYGFNSPLYKTFRGIGFEIISEESFKLILDESFSPFLSTLSFGILPIHLWENVSPENSNLTELNKKPIGTGPFQYKSFKKDGNGSITYYTLNRYDKYYDKKPYIKTINFKLFSEVETAIDSLKSAKIDGVGFLPQNFLSEMKELKNINVSEFNMPRYSALFFNPKKQELLKNKNIRKALSLAINKLDLAKNIETEEEIAYGPLDFIIKPKLDEFDIKKSAELFKKEGWKLEEGNLKKGDISFEVTITSIDNEEYIKILQYIKRQWSKLGIITNLEIISNQRITSQTIEPRNYEILFYGQILSYDPDPYPFWHSSQTVSGLNLSVFANKKIDDALESARKLNSFEERIEKYKEFQDVLKDEHLAIFLFRPTYNYPLNKKIKGVDNKFIYLPSDRFSNIYNWYIKTKKALKK